MSDNALPVFQTTRIMGRTVPLVIYFHLTAALLALVIGTIQLMRPKGTGSHRMVGWVWVTLMFSVAISSLWIP